MFETPSVITVLAGDLSHRMRELRGEIAKGAVIRIVDGVRPTEPVLYLTSECPPWFDDSDITHLRELVSASRARGATRRRTLDDREAEVHAARTLEMVTD